MSSSNFPIYKKNTTTQKSGDELNADELFKLDDCPCDICSSQDNENDLLERQKIDEICDVYSNELIDYLIENPKKYLLKDKNKQDKVK